MNVGIRIIMSIVIKIRMICRMHILIMPRSNSWLINIKIQINGDARNTDKTEFILISMRTPGTSLLAATRTSRDDVSRFRGSITWRTLHAWLQSTTIKQPHARWDARSDATCGRIVFSLGVCHWPLPMPRHFRVSQRPRNPSATKDVGS